MRCRHRPVEIRKLAPSNSSAQFRLEQVALHTRFCDNLLNRVRSFRSRPEDGQLVASSVLSECLPGAAAN